MFPVTVALLSVSVPRLFTPAPFDAVLPPVIVSSEIAADAPVLTLNTRLALLPLTESRLAPVPRSSVGKVSANVSWVPVRRMVCGTLNVGPPKPIPSEPPPLALAAVIASRSEMPSGPGLAIRAATLVTVPLTTSVALVTVTVTAS